VKSRRLSAIVLIVLATLTAGACSDDSGDGNGTGAAGSGGGAAGTGGGAAGTGGSGGGSAFMSVNPCTAESAYVTSPTTIDFGFISPAYVYQPKCLKVPVGTQVTFTSTTSDFGAHPLYPSASIGTQPGNPITPTTTGNNASFTFSAKGFWAYWCMIHGSDSGNFMAGVVWVD
jgi:plastocyanin